MVNVNLPEVGLAVASGAKLVMAGASYKNACDPINELTSTLRSLVPTPTGKTHVILLNCCTMTPLQDLDEERSLDVRETTVFNDDVPKPEP
jgi:hypothetical protein